MAEEGFRDAVASVVVELLENEFHLREHFGAAEFCDDEVVGEEGIVEWAVLKIGVEEELECE